MKVRPLCFTTKWRGGRHSVQRLSPCDHKPSERCANTTLQHYQVANCQVKQCKREWIKYRYTSDRSGNVDDTDHNLDVDESDDILRTAGALVVITV